MRLRGTGSASAKWLGGLWRRRKLEEAAAAARRVGELFSRISVEEMVEWLREARRGR